MIGPSLWAGPRSRRYRSRRYTGKRYRGRRYTGRTRSKPRLVLFLHTYKLLLKAQRLVRAEEEIVRLRQAVQERDEEMAELRQAAQGAGGGEHRQEPGPSRGGRQGRYRASVCPGQ